MSSVAVSWPFHPGSTRILAVECRIVSGFRRTLRQTASFSDSEKHAPDELYMAFVPYKSLQPSLMVVKSWRAPDNKIVRLGALRHPLDKSGWLTCSTRKVDQVVSFFHLRSNGRDKSQNVNYMAIFSDCERNNKSKRQ
ncbi:MAG: hypothetical protein R3C56_20855 [Pirellulaceae bacterium]